MLATQLFSIQHSSLVQIFTPTLEPYYITDFRFHRKPTSDQVNLTRWITFEGPTCRKPLVKLWTSEFKVRCTSFCFPSTILVCHNENLMGRTSSRTQAMVTRNQQGYSIQREDVDSFSPAFLPATEGWKQNLNAIYAIINHNLIAFLRKYQISKLECMRSHKKQIPISCFSWIKILLSSWLITGTLAY